MSEPPIDHLSQMHTLWTMVLQAKQGPDAQADAQSELLTRYSGAIYRYLLAVTRDPNVADELLQEFSLKLVRGRFPER